jgi:hypothetical protein
VRAAVIPNALVATALTVPVACGARRDVAQRASVVESTAHFSDVTTYLVQPPQKLLRALRSYGNLESVGKEAIRGVSTTHYRLAPNNELDDPDEWLEIWLDEEEGVHRLRRPAGESSPRVQEYFDFGAEIHLAPPCRIAPGASASTTLAPEKGKSTRCIEEASG